MVLKRPLSLTLALGLGLASLTARAAAPDPATEALMKKSDCFTCHSVKQKMVGPSYRDVAKKYKKDPKAVQALVTKVKNGGSGTWGAIPMSPHPDLKEADIKAMVKWVLAQK